MAIGWEKLTQYSVVLANAGVRSLVTDSYYPSQGLDIPGVGCVALTEE